MNPLGIEALRSVLGPLDTLLTMGYFGVLFASASSLVIRFRRSRGKERQQIKWLACAASVVRTWFLTNGWVVAAVSPFSGVKESGLVDGLLLAAVPIAVGIAVLRYRLYDVELIFNRALVYGALTVALASVYVRSMGSLQSALRALTGPESTQGWSPATCRSRPCSAAREKPERRVAFPCSRCRPRGSASARRRKWKSSGSRGSANATGPSCTLTSVLESSRTKTALWS